MAVSVLVPTHLRNLTANQDTVEIEGADSISGLLLNLERDYPGSAQRIRDVDGKLLRHVHLFVNGENMGFLQGIDTPLKDGDEVSIITGIAGG